LIKALLFAAVAACVTFFAVAFLVPGSPAAQSTESYGVFCARGRIVVDSRSADQMRSGQGACQLQRFSTRSDAEGFARRNFGGVGGSCSCR
jgi:hypothetical protein